MADYQPTMPAPRTIVADSTSQRRLGADPSVSSLLAFVLLLSGATFSLFLAGGTLQGDLGIFLLCAGTALVVCPPRARISTWVVLTAAVFVLCSADALLPARFFHPSIWRRTVASVPDLLLPSTVSAAPSVTLFWLAILGVSLAIGLFTLTQPLRSAWLLGLSLVAVSVCGVYAALSIYAKVSGWNYAFSGGASFGFLPNRNHTATLLITGSLLSVGILGVAFPARRWLSVDVAVAALTLCVTGLFFFSESRAGVVFLLLGVLLWVVGLGRRHRSRSLIFAISAVLLVGGYLFLVVRSDARDRLLRSIPASHPGASMDNVLVSTDRQRTGELTSDDRLRIYRDTLGVIRDAPLTGMGLGTFSLVFPAYRRALLNSSLVLHPESDWLLVTAETGLPAILCLIALGVAVCRGWKPTRNHPYWPLRWALVVAGLAAVSHGLVDVPIHRVAVGWWVLVLVGIALQPGTKAERDGCRSGSPAHTARGIFIFVGSLALGLGGLLVRAEWFGGPALPPFVAERSQAEILRTFNRGDVAGALEQARRAVQVSPLAPALYYQFGNLLLRFEDTDAEVDRAFLVQRLLTPLRVEVPEQQGMTWLPLDPSRAAALLIEAEDRRIRLEPSEVKSAVYWTYLVRQASACTQVQLLLWSSAYVHRPAFALAWLEATSKEAAKLRLPQMAGNKKFLASLNSDQMRRFTVAWENKGDQKLLKNFLEEQRAESTNYGDQHQ